MYIHNLILYIRADMFTFWCMDLFVVRMLQYMLTALQWAGKCTVYIIYESMNVYNCVYIIMYK